MLNHKTDVPAVKSSMESLPDDDGQLESRRRHYEMKRKNNMTTTSFTLASKTQTCIDTLERITQGSLGDDPIDKILWTFIIVYIAITIRESWLIDNERLCTPDRRITRPNAMET